MLYNTCYYAHLSLVSRNTSLPPALHEAHATVFGSVGERFWGFSPHRGDTLHLWGDIWHGGVDWSPPRQISPPSVQGWENGAGKKPRKFNQIFAKFCHINASHWRILCTIFTKFSGIVGIFLLGHMLKFGEIQLRGSRFQSHGSFNLRGSGYPQIFSAS